MYLISLKWPSKWIVRSECGRSLVRTTFGSSPKLINWYMLFSLVERGGWSNVSDWVGHHDYLLHGTLV